MKRLAVSGVLLALLLGETPPSGLRVFGQDGGYPVAVTGSLSIIPPAVQGVQGVDGGYPLVVTGSFAAPALQNIQGVDAGYPVSVVGTFWQTTQPVSGTFWQATQPVSGTFWQSTQPVSIASMPSTPVTGTFWQATQPVSGTFWQSTQPVSIASMPSTPVTGTFWQSTQPVSGTVTANIGTAGTLALDATLTGGTQQSKITDGTNVATVKAASTQPIASDKSLVVMLNPNQPPLTTALDINVTQIGTVGVATGGPSGSLGVGGVSATNSAITQNPVLVGAEAQSGLPAAASAGNQRQVVSNLDGAQYVVAGGPDRFSCGLSALAASLTQCQAAPAAGVFLYVDNIYVQTTTTTSGTYSVSCGTGSNCGTTNVALFPVSGTGNRFNAPITSQAMAALSFNPPLKCPTAAQELCIIGVATNTISIQVEGHRGH